MRTLAQKAPQTKSRQAATPHRAQPERIPALSPAHRLQRTIGNQALLRMLQAHARNTKEDAAVKTPLHGDAPVRMQPKLEVNAPGDVYEQEADRVADAVMRMPEPRGQADGAPETMASPVQVQTSAASAVESGGFAAPPIVHDALNSPGQPLDAATRAFMEPRFGRDFGGVRVHTGAKAAESTGAINARAFTGSRHIVFGKAEYAPQSESGRRLLAHELTHVVHQRSGGGVSPLQRQQQAGSRDTATTTTSTGSGSTTLSSGVGARGPNVVSDLRKIQSQLLRMEYLSAVDHKVESDVLLKNAKDTDKIAAARIPKTIKAIEGFERIAMYKRKPTGQISPAGDALALMNAQISAPVASDLTAIVTSRSALSATVVGGQLTLTGKVGDVATGNAVNDLYPVQRRLLLIGELPSNALAAEEPATMKAKHPDFYKAKADIDRRHIPETIKAIKHFQTQGRFNHSVWKTRKFAGKDLSALSFAQGIVAPGDLSEFILSHFEKTTLTFKDDQGAAQSVTTENFQKSKYTADAAGIMTLGTASSANFTADEFAAFGLSQVEAKALIFVSSNEGKFNALNTYDKAVISFGFIQFAGGTAGGTFPKAMATLKQDSPSVFKDKFGRYGIDVEYTSKDGKIDFATVVVVDPATGRQLRGRDAEQYLRNNPPLLISFLAAGHSKEVQKAQIKTAANEYVVPSRGMTFSAAASTPILKYKKSGTDVLLTGPQASKFAKSAEYKALPADDKQALTSFSLAGDKISDYLASEKARAVIIDQCINMGIGGARTAISKGLLVYIESNQQVSKQALKLASENDILESIRPFTSVPARVKKAIDDPSLSST